MLRLLFLLAAWGLGGVLTHAAITFAPASFQDKSKHSDTVTFTVLADPGAATTTATLDGAPIAVGAPITVDSVRFHQVVAESRTSNGTLVDTKTVRFLVRNSARGNSEDGIPSHTPYRLVNDAPSAFAGAVFKMVAPAAWPAGRPIPLAAVLRDAQGEGLRLNGVVKLNGFPSQALQLRRGWGSVVGSGIATSGPYDIGAEVNGLSDHRLIQIEANPTFTELSGTIATSTSWPAHSRIRLTSTLTVSTGATLQVGAGTIILVNSGNGSIGSAAEIVVQGTLQFNGTEAAPIVVTSENSSGFWGGIEMPSATSTVNATHTIFTQSGEDQTWFNTHSGYAFHKAQQALFLVAGSGSGTAIGAQLHLTDCFCFQLAGQQMNSKTNTWIDLQRTLMQRAVTCGELNGSKVTIDRSALIEFPSEDAQFADADNDAIYLTNGDLQLTNNVIGFTKDDGIDSGGNGGDNPFTAATDVTPLVSTNNWFEGTFHEGNSLSGTRRVTHTGCVFLNCGQGVEDGYSSSSTGDGPTAVIDGCVFAANMVGVRWGDNYGSGYQYNGSMEVKNSFLLHSFFHDAWSYDWNEWTYYTTQPNSFGRPRFDVHDNWISQPDPGRHPDNVAWNGAVHGALLAPFMPVPNSAVGVAVTSYEPQAFTTAYAGTFTVRLSTFSSRTVSVNYLLRGRRSASADEEALGSGSISFSPGETIRQVSAPVPNAADYEFIEIALQDPVNTEVTGGHLLITPPPQPQVLVGKSGWRYRETRTQPPANWRELNFDDSSPEWQAATLPAGFGVSGITFGTTVGFGGNSGDKTKAYYFRKKFTVAEPSHYAVLRLRVRRDDGLVVWLNNDPQPTAVSADGTWNAPFPYASNPPPNSSNTGNTLTIDLPANKLVPGENILALQLGQSTLSSSDLLLDAELIGIPPTPFTLGFGSSGGHALLWWYDPAAVLEHSTDLRVWSPVPGGSSPVRVTPSAGAEFWRLAR